MERLDVIDDEEPRAYACARSITPVALSRVDNIVMMNVRYHY